MEDDDLMLNIARPAHHAPAQPSLASHNKKEKYSVKFKMSQKNQRSTSRKNFEYNLLPSPDEPTKKKEETDGKVEEERNVAETKKRARHFEKEDNMEGSRFVRGEKRFKKDPQER